MFSPSPAAADPVSITSRGGGEEFCNLHLDSLVCVCVCVRARTCACMHVGRHAFGWLVGQRSLSGFIPSALSILTFETGSLTKT